MKTVKKLLFCIKNGVIYPFIINATQRRIPVQIVLNQSLRNNIAYYHGYKKLERKYHKIIESFPERKRINREIPRIIWIFWSQGLPNAPELVKACYDSICNNMHDYEIKFLDAENLSRYVEIPQFIMNKYERGIISHAHFSDYLRVALLTNMAVFGLTYCIMHRKC